MSGPRRTTATIADLRRDGLVAAIAPAAGAVSPASPATLRVLNAIAADARGRGAVSRLWAVGPRQATAPAVTVLFRGAPASGRAAAAALARTVGRDLYRIDLSRVVSRYIGETEKNLARVFDVLESADAVLLVDEAEALFGKRSGVKDSHDRYANMETSYLLQRLESSAGIAILAIADDACIDRAVLRRFRHVVALSGSTTKTK